MAFVLLAAPASVGKAAAHCPPAPSPLLQFEGGEGEYDDLAGMAQKVLGTPIGKVLLKSWVKQRMGMWGASRWLEAKQQRGRIDCRGSALRREQVDCVPHPVCCAPSHH